MEKVFFKINTVEKDLGKFLKKGHQPVITFVVPGRKLCVVYQPAKAKKGEADSQDEKK